MKRSKVKRSDYIEERYFRDALLSGGTFSSDYERLYGQQDKLTEQAAAVTYKRQLARFVSGSHAQPATGGDLVRDLLQDYTGEWLDTGIDSQGQERPFTRTLTGTGSAWSAVAGYEYAQHPVFIDWNNGLQRRRKTIAERLYVDPTEHIAAANSSTEKLPTSIKYPVGSFEHRLFSGLREYRKAKGRNVPRSYTNMPRNVAHAARLRAACLFHAFMEAPWRHKLGNCKRCHSYFVLRNKPAGTYVRGMHCSDCKNIASAGASAKTKRAERESRLLGLATDVWPSWRHQGEDRNKWIAEQVSSLFGEKKAIQRNWVTRHEKEIEAELKRRARASIPEAHEKAPTARLEVENLTSGIKRFRGVGPHSGRGKGTG